MDYLIAPTLFQNKICRLPGIGTLKIVTASAETDFINTQIKAPVHSIIFTAAQDDGHVFNEFTALSELIKRDLDEKGTVTLKSVGNFITTSDGAINFVPLHLSPVFMPAVVAKRVVRQDAEHAILVGDKETTNTLMTEYFVEDVIEKPTYRWWVAAIILAIIGLSVIAYYVSQNGSSMLGNAIK